MNNATDTGSVQMTADQVGALPIRLGSADAPELRTQSATTFDYNAARKNFISFYSNM